MNSSLLASNIVGGGGGRGGGKGVPNASDVTSFCLQKGLSTHFRAI